MRIPIVLALTCIACSETTDNTVATWPAALTLASTGTYTQGTLSVASSTRLGVTWTAPTVAFDHYQAVLTNNVTGLSVSANWDKTVTTASLDELRSGTSYTLALSACVDSGCGSSVVADATATTSTAEEYWAVQATGDSVSATTKLVSDGNTKIHAVLFGDGAPSGNAGKVQLYYGPTTWNAKGLSVGISNSVVTDATTAGTFTSYTGTYGLISPQATPTTLIKEIQTGMAVPLSQAMGGKVRLFFEANGNDGAARILYIDSVDGWLGRDFNEGNATVCSTKADYDTGGGCEPTIAIGVSTDSVNPTTGLSNVRQFKIGFPQMDDWRWDGAVGTFMFFSIDMGVCGTTSMVNQGYAVWDGSNWDVQMESASCPVVINDMQAPALMHLGGTRYKVYFGTPNTTTGKDGTSPLPFLGPKYVMYSDSDRTGDASIVDFDDWEGHDDARGINFVWPSGTLLDDTEEGYIDDFTFMMPTNDAELQVGYIVMAYPPDITPFSAMAVLINP